MSYVQTLWLLLKLRILFWGSFYEGSGYVGSILGDPDFWKLPCVCHKSAASSRTCCCDRYRRLTKGAVHWATCCPWSLTPCSSPHKRILQDAGQQSMYIYIYIMYIYNIHVYVDICICITCMYKLQKYTQRATDPPTYIYIYGSPSQKATFNRISPWPGQPPQLLLLL